MLYGPLVHVSETLTDLQILCCKKMLSAVAAICVGDWGDERRRRVSSAVGARIEALKAPRRVRCGEGEGVFPSHWGGVWGGKFFDF